MLDNIIVEDPTGAGKRGLRLGGRSSSVQSLGRTDWLFVQKVTKGSVLEKRVLPGLSPVHHSFPLGFRLPSRQPQL